MKRFFTVIVWGILAYVVGAVLTVAGVYSLSPNGHDLAIEAPMTGAFVGGPLAGLVGVLVGFFRGKG